MFQKPDMPSGNLECITVKANFYNGCDIMDFVCSIQDREPEYVYVKNDKEFYYTPYCDLPDLTFVKKLGMGLRKRWIYQDIDNNAFTFFKKIEDPNTEVFSWRPLNKELQTDTIKIYIDGVQEGVYTNYKTCYKIKTLVTN